jgi:hypothetical protein
MALLNLILAALFSALGLFETGGAGGGDAASGTATADKPNVPAGGDGDDEGADGGEPDWKEEATKWKGLARKHEGRHLDALGLKPGELDQLRSAAQRLKDAEDADKTEGQKAKDRADAAEARATKAEGQLLRLEIAAEKGLTPAQAKRLVGSTREELEADADELLEAFGGKKEPLKRPGSPARSGSIPNAESEENDPEKLAAKVPRL